MSYEYDITSLITELNALVDVIDMIKTHTNMEELSRNSQAFKNIITMAKLVEAQETVVRKKIHQMEDITYVSEYEDYPPEYTEDQLKKINSIFYGSKTNAIKELNKLYTLVEEFDTLVTTEYD